MNTELNPGLMTPLADDLVDDLANGLDNTLTVEMAPELPSKIIEAESMELSNYGYESYSFASSDNDQPGNVISLIDIPNKIGYDSGTAQTTFDGEDGVYRIKISLFDEADGEGHVLFKLNSAEVGRVDLDRDLGGNKPTVNNRRTEVIVDNIELKNGDVLTLEGFSDINPTATNPLHGEFARIDYLELQKVADLPPEGTIVPDMAMAVEDGPEVCIDFGEQPGRTYRILTQPTNELGQQEGTVRLKDPSVVAPTPTEAITIQAEDLALNGYAVDTRFAGIESISLITKQGNQPPEYEDRGTASGLFNGEAGTYTIEVGYYDESDGKSQISFFLGNDTTQPALDSWTLDDDDNSSPRPIKDGDNSNLKKHTISDVALENGAAFVLEGIRDNEEGVRIDYIRFVPVASSTPEQNQGFIFDPKPNEDFQDLGVGESRDVVFTYEAEDANAQVSEPGEVTVTVKGVNDAPVAVDDVAQTEGTAPVTIPLLDNDSDIDNFDLLTGTENIVDPLVVTQVEGEAIAINGSITLLSGAMVTLNPDGTVTYQPSSTPLPDGMDEFSYTISDDEGGESSATVKVTVETPPPIVVVATDDTGEIDESMDNPAPPNVLPGNVLDNDTPQPLVVKTVNSDPARVGQEIVGGYGTFVINEDGSYTYTLNDADPRVNGLNVGESLQEVIGYSASNSVTEDGARLTVTINGKNDPPVANDDVGSIMESEPNSPLPNITTGNVLANDTDPDNDNADLIVSTVNGSPARVGQEIVGAYGTFVLRADGTYTYTLNDLNPAVNALNDGETLEEILEYTAFDGDKAAGARLTVIINGKSPVIPINEVPIAVNDEGFIKEDRLPNPIVGNLLLNDRDPDNAPEPLRVISAVHRDGRPITLGEEINGAYGFFTINGDGSYNYRLVNEIDAINGLSEGQELTDVLAEYTISDGDLTASATLTVNIEGTNDPPIANNFSLPTIREGIPLAIGFDTLLAQTSDVEGDVLTITGVTPTNPGAGDLTFDPVNRRVVFEPNPFFITTDIDGESFASPYSFEYTVSDGSLTDNGTVDFHIQDTQPQRVRARESNGTFATANVFGRELLGVAPNTDPNNGALPNFEIEGLLGRANGRAEVDIIAFNLFEGEALTLDIDYGARSRFITEGERETLNTQLYIFGEGVNTDGIDLLVSPDVRNTDRNNDKFYVAGSVNKAGALDNDTVDLGSARATDPLVVFTAPETTKYYVAIATEDAVWKKNRAGTEFGFFDRADSDRGFSGDFLLYASLDNVNPVVV